MSFRTAYGYTHSEAGWRMCNRDECERIFIPGAKNDWLAAMIVRSGDAEVILRGWATYYHRHCEPLDGYRQGVGDDWGWSAQNDVPNSNHLAGVALDFNATKYPWGSRVMPQHLVNKINEGIRLFEGTIFHGRNWGKPDEMHYQLGFREGDSRIARFANMLRNGHLGLLAAPKPAENQIDKVAAANPWLGKRISIEIACPDKRGRFAHFEAGYVYWTAKTGAYAIPNAIFEKYAELRWETGILGYPIRASARIEGGVVQAFEGGTVYRKDGEKPTHMRGLMLDRWAKAGYENGPLGWPVTDEYGYGNGTRQDFDNGSGMWCPNEILMVRK
jgi:hypothetical protein